MIVMCGRHSDLKYSPLNRRKGRVPFTQPTPTGVLLLLALNSCTSATYALYYHKWQSYHCLPGREIFSCADMTRGSTTSSIPLPLVASVGSLVGRNKTSWNQLSIPRFENHESHPVLLPSEIPLGSHCTETAEYALQPQHQFYKFIRWVLCMYAPTFLYQPL